jgi:CheY-like chemotaxis protein
LARILAIATDALIRETLKTMLPLNGHEVALAPHGEEGQRRFREQVAELVICDISMRPGGGTRRCRRSAG